MIRKVTALALTFILLLSAPLINGSSGSKDVMESGITSNLPEPDQEPFFITNDTSLIDNATKHVWPGTGLPFDPIIISNMVIDANSTNYGIRIWNTTLSILLSNITIYNTSISSQSDLYSCIDIFNATNITITESLFTLSAYGITALNSSFMLEDTTVMDMKYDGISLENSDMDIHGSEITNCSYSAISYDTGEHLAIMNSTFQNCADGLEVYMNNDLMLRNCTFDYILMDSINIMNSNNIELDLLYLNNTYTAVDIRYSENITLMDTSFNNTNRGVYSTYCKDIHFNNLTSIFTDFSLYLNRLTDYIVEQCDFLRGRIGLYLTDMQEGIIKDNRIKSMGDKGIAGYRLDQDISLERNRIMDCNTGFDSYSCHGLTINGLTIEDSMVGIEISWSNFLTVKECSIFDSEGTGIDVYRSYDLALVNNTISDSGSKGIYISNLERAGIINNTLVDCYNAMEIDYCDDLRIEWNRVKEGETGIIARGVDDSVFSHNSFMDNRYNGIVITEGSNDMVHDNLFLKMSFFGLNLFTSTGVYVWNNTFAYNNGANDTYDISRAQGSDNRADNSWSHDSRGNHWTEWTGPDQDENDIVDDPYQLAGMMNTDPYPLSEPLHRIVPSPPLDLTSVSTNSSIDMKWDPPSSDGGDAVLGFVIYRSNGTGLKKYKEVDSSVLEFVDTDVEEGVEYTYRMTAFNSIGESPISKKTKGIMDSTVPKVIIRSPPKGSNINSNDVLLDWTIVDGGNNADNSSYRIDGGPWNEVEVEIPVWIEIEDNGEHHIEIRVFDTNGNWNSSSVSFTIDTVLPEIEILKPLNNSYTNETTLEFHWTGSDLFSGIDRYEIRWDNIYWIPKGTNTATVINGLSEGKHELFARAFDLAGNVNVVSVNLTVDLDDPFVTILSPIDGLILNRSDVTIKWTGGDETSPSLTYFISIDGGEPVLAENISHFEAFLGYEGRHSIEVIVYDEAGNHGSDIINITVDELRPEVIDFGPEDEGYVEIDEEVFVVFSENMSIEDVRFNIQGVFSFINWYGTKAVLSLDGGLLPGKTYRVVVTGSDIAGNPMEVFQWTFTTNSSSKVMGKVVDGSSRPIENVEVLLEGSLMAKTDEKGYFEMLLDPGEYTLRFEKMGFDHQIREITLSAGDEKDLGNIMMIPEIKTGIVKGRVVDKKGEPVLGVIINSNSGVSDTTDEQGMFSLDLTPGKHRLSFSRDLYMSLVVNVTVQEDVEIELEDVVMEKIVEDENTDSGLEFYQIQIIVFVIILIIGIIAIYALRRRQDGNLVEE